MTAQDRHLVQRFRLARIEMQMLGKSQEDFRQENRIKSLMNDVSKTLSKLAQQTVETEVQVGFAVDLTLREHTKTFMLF